MPLDLSALSDDDLWSELARRSSKAAALAPADAAARAILVKVCAQAGFPAPRPEVTLIEWADTALDSPLGPRGCAAWREGHERVLDALTAAMEGSAPIARVCLGAAVDVVQAHANRACACAPRPPTVFDASSDRAYCARCHLRQR